MTPTIPSCVVCGSPGIVQMIDGSFCARHWGEGEPNSTPKPGVIQRVRRFFEDNPDEELTYRLLVEKFGCTLWTARRAVYALVEDGVVESVHVIRHRSRGVAQRDEVV